MKKKARNTREEPLAEINTLKQALTIAEKHNKVLNASNQQLQAAEQQIRAAIQQLKVTEQQLRAANQQLEASQKALRKEKEFSESLLETANSFVVVLNVNGSISLFNKYAENLTNYQKEEVLGKNWFELFIPASVRDELPEVFLNVLREMPEFSSHENAIKCKDGSEKWIRWKNTVLKTNGKKISGILSIGVDITERKKSEQQIQSANQQLRAAEQQLRAANQQLEAGNKELSNSIERYKALITVSNTGAWEYHLDTDFLWCSPEYFSMLGRDVNDYDLSGVANLKETWIDLLHPDDRDRASNHFSNYLKKGSPGMYENYFRLQHSDGHWVWILSRGSTIRDEKGKVTNLTVGTHIDITEREKAEEKLKANNQKLLAAEQQLRAANQQLKASNQQLAEKEKKFRLLTTNALDTIWTADTHLNMTFVNDAIFNFLGFTPAELLKLNATAFTPPEGIKALQKAAGHLISLYKREHEVVQTTIELQQRKKNGELIDVEITANLMLDDQGEIAGFQGRSIDITERKHKEQIQKIIYNISNAAITPINLQGFAKIIQNELSKIIDTTNFYIALFDEKAGHFVFIFQRDKKDNFSTLPVDKTLTGYVFKTKKPLLATKKVIEELEKSGELELFGAPSESWLGVPLVIDGKAIGVFAVQSYDNETAFNESDIAILEIISYQISTSIDRKRKVEELKTALEKAQESDRLKSAFLANMSHEIRTPMNGIIGFTNLLNTPEIDKEERQQYIAIINKSGNRLLNTINDLIDISKIEAGQMKISKAKTSVNNILLEVNSFFKHETASKGLSIISLPTLSEKEATIITDQDKLLGILTNLIKNAIKFTKKGSITFGYFLKGNFLEFFVKDTGIGIPENRRQAVFNRFEQADIGNGYTRSFEGSGLGLAISQDYVKMLGGRIWLTSEEGKGTTFRFTIPYDTELVQPPEIPVKARQPSRKEVATKTLDLLIAEDEETSFLYLKTILNDRFRKIYYAKTGKETIKICKENPKINIILMDIKMPDINGLEATREIRIFNKDVVIIAQTAFALAGDEEKAIAAGCNDYISKPIDRDKLIRLINQYI